MQSALLADGQFRHAECVSTETELREWRTGSTQAERLCADILVLQEFDDVDPQAPLGGSDDRKDILCTKGGIRYVAGVYFPPTAKAFADIRTKFCADLAGVVRHGREGFIFLTNQRLTLDQRGALAKEALETCRDCQIFHLERIRTILDQPSGYGIRLQYLRIPLSTEEQFAYFTHASGGVERQLERQNRMLGAINRKIDHLVIAQDFVVQTMALNARAEGVSISPPPSRSDLFLGGAYRAPPDARGFSAATDTTQLVALHRAICFDAPTNEVGRLRDHQVYLARSGEAADQAVALPPKPEDVPDALMALCKDWTNGISGLNAAGAEGRLQAIARFHAEFLRIHPFADGNGRVARFLLMQQCLDLFGVADMGVLDKGAEYYAALQSADHDDVAALVKLICPIVGIESDAE